MKSSADVSIDVHALDRAAARIASTYDPMHGGFGNAPKFPPSMSLDFLMQVASRTQDQTGDPQLCEIVVNTLTIVRWRGR